MNKSAQPQKLEGILTKKEEGGVSFKEDEQEDDDVKRTKKYINANYVNGLVMNRSLKSFIACQAPLQKSNVKFWQMIWENKSTLMIMVCPCIGPKGGEESFKYWQSLDKVGDETEIGSHFKLKLLKLENLNDGRIIHKQFELHLIGTYGKKQTGGFDIADSDEPDEPLVIDHFNAIDWIDDTAKKEETVYQDIDCLIDQLFKFRTLSKIDPSK